MASVNVSILTVVLFKLLVSQVSVELIFLAEHDNKGHVVEFVLFKN